MRALWRVEQVIKKVGRWNGNYLCTNECVGENVVAGDCDEASLDSLAPLTNVTLS
jgi:hypothetical protein